MPFLQKQKTESEKSCLAHLPKPASGRVRISVQAFVLQVHSWELLVYPGSQGDIAGCVKVARANMWRQSSVMAAVAKMT